MNQSWVVIAVSPEDPGAEFHQGLEKIFLDLNYPIRFSRNINVLKGTLECTFDFELVNSSLMNLAALYRIDIALIPSAIFDSPKKLVVFDMDSTLITAEVIDEMASKHGVGDKVKLITTRAMNGELDFNQSLTERVSLLKGFHRRHMQDILSELTFTPGTAEFLQTLKQAGIKTAIASGGFEYFARHVQEKLQMDYCFANNLEFDGDVLSGNIHGPIVNAEVKQQIVTELAQKEHLRLDQVVAIGDGANDIPMLLKAGLGIAIHAKEKVQKAARYRINYGPMTSALSYMNLD
jgi:phosphoserine phosphatase